MHTIGTNDMMRKGFETNFVQFIATENKLAPNESILYIYGK